MQVEMDSAMASLLTVVKDSLRRTAAAEKATTSLATALQAAMHSIA
jgi:hypothetical protein